jgi:hypothetical protein
VATYVSCQICWYHYCSRGESAECVKESRSDESGLMLSGGTVGLHVGITFH